MGEDLEQLKQRLPLLDYLRQHNWSGRRAGARQEFVGLCPLHPESRPSFYVNARQESVLLPRLWTGRRSDSLCRVVPASLLSVKAWLISNSKEFRPAAGDAREQAVAFYQQQLPRHPEALRYLERRGVHDPALIEELGIGYAPGGNLRRHLPNQGYSLESLQRDRSRQPAGPRYLLPAYYLPLRPG